MRHTTKALRHCTRKTVECLKAFVSIRQHTSAYALDVLLRLSDIRRYGIALSYNTTEPGDLVYGIWYILQIL
jgi:hypothetical protein